MPRRWRCFFFFFPWAKKRNPDLSFEQRHSIARRFASHPLVPSWYCSLWEWNWQCHSGVPYGDCYDSSIAEGLEREFDSEAKISPHWSWLLYYCQFQTLLIRYCRNLFLHKLWISQRNKNQNNERNKNTQDCFRGLANFAYVPVNFSQGILSSLINNILFFYTSFYSQLSSRTTTKTFPRKSQKNPWENWHSLSFSCLAINVAEVSRKWSIRKIEGNLSITYWFAHEY